MLLGLLRVKRVLNLPQPLDPVAEQHPLLVVHYFVAVAGFGFPKNRALDLVADSSAVEYPVSGHEDVPSWSGRPGVQPPRAPLLYLTPLF